MIIITDLPNKNLFPNVKLHWAQKAKYKKFDFAIGLYHTKQLLGRATSPFITTDSLIMDLTFVFPDKRRRDLDNCIAAFKSLQDGIFKALKIDDHQIKTIKETKILYDKDFPHTHVELILINFD